MKVELLILKSSRNDWAEEAIDDYTEKIKRFIPFEVKAIKSSSRSREHLESKLIDEEKKILKSIDSNDHLILFDERGKAFKDSVAFSDFFVQQLESVPGKIVFLIGGPYGVTKKIKSRANIKISLSQLTMNHFVAQITALEQIYRALTIWKNKPYHNV